MTSDANTGIAAGLTLSERIGRCAVLIFLLFCSCLALAQEQPQDLTQLSLEELMNIEVYGASKYVQSLREAPSAVTIVTAEDIRSYGYRTLADVLRSVRGFYVSNDRNYSYVGVRGFSPPGDYNGRILLLVDGHRLNDNLYDGALIGTEFPVDIDAIDRIEIIRGPSSSLYGTNAFLGVINVITRDPRKSAGLTTSLDAGSFGTYTGHLQWGTRLPYDGSALIAGSFSDSDGQTLFFPEFDDPATNYGVARDADFDQSRTIMAKLKLSHFQFQTLAGTRKKGIPTASFGTMFNDPGTRTIDSQGFFTSKYDRDFGDAGALTATASFNRYRYSGWYVYANPDVASGRVMNRDFGAGDWWGLDAQFRRRLGSRHNVVVGGEYRNNFRQDQKNFDIDPFTSYLDDQRTSVTKALYAQDEIKLASRVMLNLGVRHDTYLHHSTTNPRFGLLISPSDRTTLKLLFGTAFREGNAYEAYYAFGDAQKSNPGLRPETIRTYEIAADHYTRSGIRISASAYAYLIKDLIQQVKDDSDGRLVFENVARVRAKGVELEVERKWSAGFEARASYSLQTALEDRTNILLSNSPKHLAKVNGIVPVFRNRLFLAADAQFIGRRAALSGDSVGSATVLNFTALTRELSRHVDVAFTAYNVFDMQYADPAASEHRQLHIPQDGRSFRVKLSYSTGDKSK